jgi:hypothetical protein
MYPSADFLAELGAAKHTLVPPLGRLIEDPVTEADALLDLGGAGADDGENRYPFNPRLSDDLDYASLVIPRTLLKAYEATGNERYFDAARRFFSDWSAYELGAWLPEALLWNDHAVAVRSATYSEFWRLCRQHRDFEMSEAKTFLQLVSATGARLANAVFYTHASNRGTMQNLGLMHLGLAFPDLEGFVDYPELAINRQQEQLAYMVSSEGVVLEHSAGYHRLGMELTGVMLRYLTLHGETIPEGLWKAYDLMRSVFRQLRGPDDLLPPLGDSNRSEA